MLKYNYTGAAALWDKYFNLVCEPWMLCGEEKRQERRNFMRAVTHCEGIELYTHYIQELIEEARPVKDAKSRCFNFEYERELEELKHDLVIFSHCIERWAE